MQGTWNTHTFNRQELIGFAGQVHYLHLVETQLDDATIFFRPEDETTTSMKRLYALTRVSGLSSLLCYHSQRLQSLLFNVTYFLMHGVVGLLLCDIVIARFRDFPRPLCDVGVSRIIFKQ